MKKLLLLFSMGLSIAPVINAEDIDVTLRSSSDLSNALNNEILGKMDGKASISFDKTTEIYTINDFLGYKDADNNGVKLQFTIGEDDGSGRYRIAAYDANLDRTKTLDEQSDADIYYKWVGGQVWVNPDDPTDIVEWKDPDGNLSYTQFYLPLQANPDDDASVIFEPHNSNAFIGDDLEYKLINPKVWMGAYLTKNRAYATKDGDTYNVYFQVQCATHLKRPADGIWAVSTTGLEGFICFSFNPSNSTQTGIDDIVIESTDAPVEYFTLQGVKVENPSNGIYIRRQGDKVTKVAI